MCKDLKGSHLIILLVYKGSHYILTVNRGNVCERDLINIVNKETKGDRVPENEIISIELLVDLKPVNTKRRELRNQ